MLTYLFLENLKNYFTQYGEVLECMIMKDAITKRSRYINIYNFHLF
jgi:RNA recognition motif-containing protein